MQFFLSWYKNEWEKLETVVQHFVTFLKIRMLTIRFRAGTIGAGASLRFEFGFTKMMRLIAATDPQH
jgi:hypothetical protein